MRSWLYCQDCQDYQGCYILSLTRLVITSLITLLEYSVISIAFYRLLKIKDLIGMDAEWGLAMRLDSTVKYPWQMTLGAIEDDQLVYLYLSHR